MRKLVSIQQISDLQPIPLADAIEVASILGWKVVVKKGEFSIGDLCVYAEIDSVLPERPEFEFLRAKKFRIKTIRLRGQISQGICFPLSILPIAMYEEGQDVTEILGVTLYEPEVPISLHGLVRGVFPSYIPKTDETRIQSHPELLEELRGEVCYISVKLDGTSATYSHKEGDLHACGKNLSYKFESNNAYVELFNKYDLANKLPKMGNFAIQGEIVGPKLQNNPLKLKHMEFFAFNVFDINKYEYLNYSDFISFCKELSVPTVPIITDTFLFDNSVTVESLLEMSKGFYEGTKNHREGIVIRPLVNKYSNILCTRLSVKVINNDYL